jgi:hypothetical protein
VDVVGTWRKTETPECAGQYPDEIEFREATFLARKGPGQGFIVWDAGGYRVAGADEIMIETATDEQVHYRALLEGDTLTFVDRDGCEFRYRREGG